MSDRVERQQVAVPPATSQTMATHLPLPAFSSGEEFWDTGALERSRRRALQKV